MKKVELLAPAGDFECFKAAVNNGADAVYIGGNNFSARKSAKNFSIEEIKEAVRYAHLRKVKVYLALNTLLTDDELDEAYDLVKKYYDLHVDALIIQDLGLYYRIKKEFPDFDLHASTQMHIHNLQGIKNAKSLGFKRVIIARETSLDNIKEFCKEDIEIECFVHGAICVSYSGQCLMSFFTKNRSANRGECAQCCRLKYKYINNNKKYRADTDYLLSPKDMMLIKDIPSLIDAGISSFKIEGRLKSPSYVAYVTRIYREAIDSYYNNKKYVLSNSQIENLNVVFNRGYTNSYLYGSNDDLFNNIRPNHLGIEVGTVLSSSKGSTQIKLKKQLKIHDAIRIINCFEDYGTELFEITINNNKVQHAERNDIISIKTSKIFNKGDLVLKTSDKELEKNIFSSNLSIGRNLYINLACKPNQNIYINCEVDSYKFIYTSDYKPELPINYPIDENLIRKQFNKTDKHPYKIDSLVIDFEDCFIPIKVLNEIRRDFFNKLDEYILSKFKRKTINVECSFISIMQQNYSSSINIINNRFHDYYLNPLINNSSNYKIDNNIVTEFGGLLLKNNKIGFYTLNVFNSYAYELLLRLNFNKIMLSVELDEDHIFNLINRFMLRNNMKIFPCVLTEGDVDLMNIYKDPFEKQFNKLTDGKYVYKIVRKNGYTSLSCDYKEFRNIKTSSRYVNVCVK